MKIKSSLLRKILYGLLGTIVAALLIGLGAATYVIGTRVYRPILPAEKQAQLIENTVSLSAYHPEQFTLQTTDGINLDCLLIARPQAKRVILVCHGYRMTKEHMARFVAMFPHDTLMLFDFRAHGKSGGSLVSFGLHEQQDIKAVINFLATNPQTQHLPLVGIGVSMGAATLIGAAANGAPFKALVLDSSFANFQDQVKYQFVHLTGMPSFLLPLTQRLFELAVGASFCDLMPVCQIGRVTCPILIIHSRDDTFTPLTHAQQLFDAATTKDKKIWLVNKSKHGFISKDYTQEYEQRVERFLGSLE